ncbi:hypothetical protein [Neobacillus cucumis]|uniref:hypothetical protein n=1 Tax=Neobacillus cucumis TaxID=1740721 RepID=UPI00285305E2|nr:hypothetical protein [Neobacillus cucumis]MDR4948109.1 hypothetical protein [Neobacillus cucumis]
MAILKGKKKSMKDIELNNLNSPVVEKLVNFNDVRRQIEMKVKEFNIRSSSGNRKDAKGNG